MGGKQPLLYATQAIAGPVPAGTPQADQLKSRKLRHNVGYQDVSQPKRKRAAQAEGFRKRLEHYGRSTMKVASHVVGVRLVAAEVAFEVETLR